MKAFIACILVYVFLWIVFALLSYQPDYKCPGDYARKHHASGKLGRAATHTT